MDQQQGDRGGSDAGDAFCLADRLRPMLVELLLNFGRQPAHGAVIEIAGQLLRLLRRVAENLVVLALDVPGVLGRDLDLLRDASVHYRTSRARQAHELGITHSGPAQKLDQRVLPVQRLTENAFGFRAAHHLRIDPAGFDAFQFRGHRVPVAAKRLPSPIVDDAERAAGLGQTQVGVVLAQLQSVLGAAGKHAVGLGDAARDEVVDQHAQVGLVAARTPSFLADREPARVDTRKDPCAAASS